jgi:hypothetical protein
MSDTDADEGVTKFNLLFTPAPALPDTALLSLNAWRTICWRLGLIGQDPARYGGVGFGNVSQRLPPAAAPRFAISGTQTGRLAALEACHYAVVTACDPARNRVTAHGPIAPSSESLTHGMLYRVDAAVRVILHVHSPTIWRHAQALALPRTADNIGYGTPGMAREMARLWRSGALTRRRLLVMGGHTDGVLAFGRTAEQAGVALLRAYAAACARLRP